MSHSVAIKTECKDLEIVLQTYQELGWRIITNSKARTYPSDPARNTVYEYVAVNPSKSGRAYDIGIKQKGELYEFVCDFFDSSIAQQLGKNLNKVKQTYAVNLAKKLYEDVQILEMLQDGTLILECEDGLC